MTWANITEVPTTIGEASATLREISANSKDSDSTEFPTVGELSTTIHEQRRSYH